MVSCPRCNEENPSHARFCLGCGSALDAPRPAGAAERKLVTVLFCDLVDFTTRADGADPEDVRAAIQPYHRMLRRRIEAFGGTVEKFIGDAVMAVFGAPVAHEDDAERAVRAGLDVLAALEDLNAGAGLDLQVRIGIETGEALVELDARPERGEGFVSGDVVNTAARLQAGAPVGGIAVGAGTHQATRLIFDYEELAPIAAKGKAEPLAAWRVVAARARFGVDLTRVPSTPLVGREIDLALLTATFQKALAASAVQLVTLVGEPGIGKSRLVAEFSAWIDDRPELVTWRQGRCLPYGEGITFWALGEIVKAHAGILDSDDAATATSKLENAVAADHPDREWVIRRLAPLVGLATDSTIGVEAIERDEAFAAWLTFLESAAASGPAVFVFEDLHWADPALLTFLEHAAEWSEGVPLLLLCTARPEFHDRHPGWGGGKRSVHTVALDRLSDEETTRLVGALLDHAGLDHRLAAVVRDRAGGNPLYAEELVRMLRDRADTGTPAEISLPDSLQALIAARLDTLPPERKALLHDAAVIGKVFWAGAVASMGGREDGDVREALHELARKELVRPARLSSVEGDVEYAFWHAFVRDAAYAQIPRATRAAKHVAAAAWMEQHAAGRLEDVAELLAFHYEQALALATVSGQEDVERLCDGARRFLGLAAERTIDIDVPRALPLLARALALTPPYHPDRPELLLRSATASWLSGDAPDPAAFEVAADAFRAMDDARGTARALYSCAYAFANSDRGHALDALAEAIDLLEPLGPTPELAAAYVQLANDDLIEGRTEEAIAGAEHGLTLAREVGDEVIAARARGVRGSARASQCDPGGIEEMREALTAGLTLGSGREVVIGHVNLAVSLMVMEGPAAALAVVEQAVELARARGLAEAGAECEEARLDLLTWAGDWDVVLAGLDATLLSMARAGSHYASELQGDALLVYVARGRPETAATAEAWWAAGGGRAASVTSSLAVGVAESRLAAGDRGGALAILTGLGPDLAPEVETRASLITRVVRVQIGAGDLEGARRWAEPAPLAMPFYEHAVVTARALIAEADGDLEAAQRAFDEAAASWSAFGVPYEKGLALLGRGRCLTALGHPEAEAVLRDARRMLEGLRAAPAVAEADRLLNGLAPSAPSWPGTPAASAPAHQHRGGRPSPLPPRSASDISDRQ